MEVDHPAATRLIRTRGEILPNEIGKENGFSATITLQDATGLFRREEKAIAVDQASVVSEVAICRQRKGISRDPARLMESRCDPRNGLAVEAATAAPGPASCP